MPALAAICSGNTKMGCLESGDLRSASLPYGSVTLRNAALKEDPDYQTGLKNILVQKVRPSYEAQQGCIVDRHRIYWIGGAAWATATFAHPETALWGYINISSSDIDEFLRELTNGSWLQRQPQFHFAADVTPAARERIEKAHLADRKSVSEVFSREDLLAGVSLMKTILQVNTSSPTVYFVRNGNYLFGYALEKYHQDTEDVNAATPVSDSKGPSYFAGIDLGARGVKAYVYRFVNGGEGPDARALFKDEVNTKLVSAAEGNRFTANAIQEAKDAVVKLLGEMKTFAEEKQITPRYYIVGSSGVVRFDNHDDLKEAVDRATGLSLEFIDAKTEALLGLKSAVPDTRRQEALEVDIGSSNTKLGCLVRDVFNPVELPYGTVTLRKAVSTSDDYISGLQTVLQQVRSAYNTERMNTPCLGSRKRLYFIGGAAWATATFAHPEAALWGYVPLTREDIATFLQHLQDGTWNQTEPQFRFSPKVTQTERDAIRKQHSADVQSVQDVFSREDLLAGASLLRTIMESANPSAQAWFVRNGNYLFGYALEKYNDIRFDEESRLTASSQVPATSK
jgi:rRNA processing protein Gar1